MTTTTNTGYSNDRAAKGQAINLAVHEAVSLGKQDDTTYILSRYLHYYKLSQLIQGLTVEAIEGEING
jgi:hypothetical protein